MFEEADNFADIFRNIPYCLLVALPIMIICSSNPVLAASEFRVHRGVEFDLLGNPYGTRSAAISFEAKSLYSWATNRHCVVAKLEDLNLELFREIRQKAGGLIVLLPRDVSTLNAEQMEQLNLLEEEMLTQSSSIPIYFSAYNVELEQIIGDITRTTSKDSKMNASGGKRESAISELFNTVSANGYQVVVTGSSNNINKNSKITVIQGELAPAKYLKQLESGIETNLPVILITAPLKTFGIYNEYPLNADAAVFLSLAEIFSKLYSTASTAPKFRLLFLLTESGSLLNFQGVKKWLDENVQLPDHLVSITGNLIAAKNSGAIDSENLDFVLCLDTIVKALENAKTNEEQAFYMHVSKPPKEGTPMHKFFKLLKSVASKHNNMSIDGVHKRINLADQLLAWEHERFSIRRLPAFTLSALKTPKDPVRLTIFKDSEKRILKQAEQSTKIIAEALVRYVYNIDVDEDDGGEIFAGATAINEKLVKSYMHVKSALHNNDLRNFFEKHLCNVKLTYDKPDAREPDFMFYDSQDGNLNVYSVKPAVFDLLLTVIISAYLVSVYFIIQYFPHFYDVCCKVSRVQLVSANGNHTHYNGHERSKAKTN